DTGAPPGAGENPPGCAPSGGSEARAALDGARCRWRGPTSDAAAAWRAPPAARFATRGGPRRAGSNGSMGCSADPRRARKTAATAFRRPPRGRGLQLFADLDLSASARAALRPSSTRARVGPAEFAKASLPHPRAPPLALGGREVSLDARV